MIAVFEGVGIALSSLVANKGRAALTILGVAIGVMVVMVVASMVRGINDGVDDVFAQLGPRTFFVFRYWEAGITVRDGSDENNPWRRNPGLTVIEAERISQLPSVHTVVVSSNSSRPVKYNATEISSVNVRGTGSRWTDVSGGDVFPGRSFTVLEEAANSRVVVVNKNVADQLFSRTYPLDRQIKIDGVPFEVIGVFTPPPDIFGAGSEPQVIIPHGSFTKYIRRAGRWMDMIVSPQAEVTMASAIDDVTATLRSMRRLRPGEDNNFTVVTQDALLDDFDNIAGTFFLVMIALSSVGLLVGGVGVVAIMMISVTERTREIGVRKALGARRREILWQFLVEAVTLTAIGGIIGMAAGGLITFIVARVTPLPATVPFWSVVAALLAAVLTGVGFGMYPAARAAKLDPVEALRYE